MARLQNTRFPRSTTSGYRLQATVPCFHDTPTHCRLKSQGPSKLPYPREGQHPVSSSNPANSHEACDPARAPNPSQPALTSGLLPRSPRIAPSFHPAATSFTTTIFRGPRGSQTNTPGTSLYLTRIAALLPLDPTRPITGGAQSLASPIIRTGPRQTPVPAPQAVPPAQPQGGAVPEEG